MTTQQLEALLIDQALGELSGEASALLEAYLDHFPERRAEADRVRRAVGLTETAVVSRPFDLEAGETILALPRKTTWVTPILRAAAAVALLGFAVGAGFFAGKGTVEPQTSAKAVAGPETGTNPSPWARYRFEEDGRLAVILPSGPNS